MKRIAYLTLIMLLLSMLTLMACSGNSAPETATVQGLIPPWVASEPYSGSLAGAANASSGASVPALCNGAQDTNTAAYAAEVIRLANVERTRVGVPSLTAQSQLGQAAQKHTIDMACNFFMDHVGTDGSWPWDRMAAFGYNFTQAGENVASGDSSPAGVMSSWMGSPDHRNNILSTNYTEVGVGYVYNPNDPDGWDHYWTMLFGAR